MQATKACYKFLSNTGGLMLPRSLSLLVFSLATSGLLAQSTPQIQEPEPSVQSLLERIQRLEKRIGELEDHQRTQAAVGAEISGPAVVESGNTQSGTVPEQPPEHQHAPSTTAVREAERHYPSLQIRGFGDVDFSATDQKGSVSGFNLGLGNGRSSILSKAGDNGDSNDNRAWVASVFARPARLYGLQFGGAVYRDKLTPEPGRNFEELITSAHLVWTKEHPEFLSEFANVHHRDVLTSNTYNSQAFYIQLAYRLPWQENKWKPYYRFEYIHKPESDPVFLNVSDLVGSTVGVRYDITNYAAFKGEYRNSRIGRDEPRVNGGFFQTAFTF